MSVLTTLARDPEVLAKNLPNIWQQLSAALAADDRVTGVWLGGSYAAGRNDEYSDIDLAAQAPDSWDPSSLGELWVGGLALTMGGRPFFQGILSDGTILDLTVSEQAPEHFWPIHLVAAAKPRAAEPDPIGPALEFWINSHKHRKVLGRGLGAMCAIGLHYDRLLLVRLWSLADSGSEPEFGLTIHGLSSFVRNQVSPERRRILGLPGRDDHETADAIRTLRDEVSRTGRLALDRFGVQYPFRAERVVQGFVMP